MNKSGFVFSVEPCGPYDLVMWSSCPLFVCKSADETFGFRVQEVSSLLPCVSN